MNMRGGVFFLPKDGSLEEDYEDAFYPSPFPERIELPFYCAVADGATETSYSALWARLIVEGYCQASGDKAAFEQHMAAYRERWGKETSNSGLPWYAEQKLEMGAFAALLGLSILKDTATGMVSLQALAIGDTCLFHVRASKLQASFPATTQHELLSRPFLLSSHRDAPETLAELSKETSIAIEPGDLIFVATDAVAAWIFISLEEGKDPFDSLNALVTGQAEFSVWIGALRSEAAIKNDDCTLIWLLSDSS